jgi:hypothetical protein
MPNLTVQNLIFTGGQKLVPNSSIPVMANKQLSISAASYISQPDPAKPGEFITYGFQFWNDSVNGITTSQTDKIKIPNPDIQASAWYATGGPGPRGIWIWAFSETDNVAWPDTAIESVQPPLIWNHLVNPNFVITEQGPVDIKVKAKIPGHDGQPFIKFVKLPEGSVPGPTITAPTIHAIKDDVAYILAIYKAPFTICQMGQPHSPCVSGMPNKPA